MYETNESKIDWNKIIKRGAIIFVGILVILAVIALIMKFSKKSDDDTKKTTEPFTLSEQLDVVENALLEYLDENSIPREINGSKTVRVKMLKDKGLINDLIDGQDNVCDINNSFAEITKLEDNYAVNISLTCGSNRENRLIYIGCFSRCDGKVCKGTSEETGGACFEGSKNESNESNKSDNTSKTDSSNKDNKTTNKPSSNKSSSTSSSNKPSSNNSASKPNDSSNVSQNSIKKETLYEYKKCNTSYSCKTGKLNSNNKCVVESSKRVFGNYSVESGFTSKNSGVEKVLNTNSIKYVNIGYDVKNGVYKYTKYSCYDASYNIDLANKNCYLDIVETNEYDAVESTSCDYTWSYSDNLEGWVKTGNTK